MKDTKHPNAAKLFMEFCYSAENAIEDIEEFGLPLRSDTVLPAGYKKLDDLKTIDRKSTRLNSSHANISYAVFCLKKKTRRTSLHALQHSAPLHELRQVHHRMNHTLQPNEDTAQSVIRAVGCHGP